MDLTNREEENSRSARGKRFIEKLMIGVVVVSTLAALGNSFTWHLQRFWGASGDFWQQNWEKLYYIAGGDSFLFGAVGTILVPNLVFWIVNIILLTIDLTGKPEFILRYRVQEDKNVPLDRDKFYNAVKTVIFNQTVVGIPVTFIGYQLLLWRGCTDGPTLPTFHRIIFDLMICILVEEIAFYYSHRLLHHPLLYKHIHKKHHEWTAPIGIIALYAHPFEHVVSNLGPAFLGILIAGSHVSTAWLWFCLALLSTSNAHSGYHLPFFPSPEFHDYHHMKFNQCYGALGILDALHNTDEQFRHSIQHKRHYLTTDTVPLRQIYPDPPKNDGKRQHGTKILQK